MATINTSNTFGALLIGALITMTIYGITTLQTYFYYISFPKDGRATKILVAFIWILDTLHAIFMCHAVHFYLIYGFSDHRLLVDGTWRVNMIIDMHKVTHHFPNVNRSLFSSIALNVLLAFIVQAFFTYRIFLLCSMRTRIWVAGTIALFVVAHFAFGLSTAVQLAVKKRFTLLQQVSLTSVLPFAITTILSDIIIAVALCLLLASNRSTFDDTNSIINRLIIYAINRCILTCAVAIVETIVFTVVPNTFYSFAIDFIIGKLYANSLLAVLNSRTKLRPEAREEYTSTELSTRFIVSSGMASHQTDPFQIRTRESHRNHISVDLEKRDDKQMDDPIVEESLALSSGQGDRDKIDLCSS